MGVRFRKLLVFGKTVKIVYKKLTDCVGLTNYKTIYITTGISEELRIETMLHELFHCTIERTGLNQFGIDPKLEEIIVDNLAKVINENFTLTQKNLD